ncbi:beta-1,4-xylanase [Oscillatoria acuminata PCC 6304]|uniref:Beta-1,4-xylanase n=2 Tax=Oscillatoria acuminata TaxID=118323 RepID=K9THE1_9CYAN|nr:beta-1,4-xylanase [Oscillatoria acuminata PCC 6304]
MKKLKTQLIIFIVLLILSLTTAVSLSSLKMDVQVDLQAPTQPIPASLFGNHIHHVATTPTYVTDPPISTLTPWPIVPFYSWRLMSAYVEWFELEPRKGEWNFTILDKSVALAEENGVEILLNLGLTPRWASARPQEPSLYATGTAAEPKNIEDWRNYVRTVATRYKGRIHYYELWNEPNLKGFYTGSLETMLTLCEEAYRILKEVDSSITVVSPPPTDAEHGIEWLNQYLARGGGAYADVIGFHFYVPFLPPETMVPLIHEVQMTMAKYGVGDKPLWNTETGWLGRAPFSDEWGAAGFVARSYILNWAAGVARLYWYVWDNQGIYLRLTQADRTTPTQAGIAYGELQQWLVGAQMNNCQAKQMIWTCELTRDRDYKAWIVWNTEGSSRFQVPEEWGVQQVRDLAGEQQLLRRNGVEIGPSPLLLEHPSS